MAPVTTRDISSVTMQHMLDAHLNGFAVDLLVESYAAPKRTKPLGRLCFVWRGVVITIDEYRELAPVAAVELRAEVEALPRYECVAEEGFDNEWTPAMRESEDGAYVSRLQVLRLIPGVHSGSPRTTGVPNDDRPGTTSGTQGDASISASANV